MMGLSAEIYKELQYFNLDIKIEVEELSRLGFLGASGSGKSMALKCITGLVTPDKGKVIINDRVVFDSEKGINIPVRERGVGLLFQNYALFPNMTVRDNIAFGLKKLSKKEQNRRIEQQTNSMRIEHLIDRYPYQLSGGEQQRTALARVLVTQPECLLLDEPFSALDNHIRNELEKELLEVFCSYKGSVIFVSHNLEECYRISDNIMIIEKGNSVSYGGRDEVFLRPSCVSAARITGCRNITRIHPISERMVKAEDWGCNLVIRKEDFLHGASHLGIREHAVKFADHTLDLTVEENVFPCWVAHTVETPYNVLLYLKLHEKSSHKGDYHLEMKVSKEKYIMMNEKKRPWSIQLSPDNLFLMRD